MERRSKVGEMRSFMELGVVSKRLEVFQDQVAGHTGEQKNQQQDDFGEDTNLQKVLPTPMLLV